MENVLFFVTCMSSPHLETDLELMLREKNNGNNVFWLFCDADMEICDSKTFSKQKKCTECIRIKKKALRLLGENIQVIPLCKYKKKIWLKIKHKIPVYNDVNALINTNYESFDLGYGIASSMANELDKNPIENFQEKISIYYSEALFFYNCVKEVIKNYSITKGYIFNGRFCFSRAFFRAFKSSNVDICTHERGSSHKKYAIYKNTLPHDISMFTQVVDNLWDNEKDGFLKKNIAEIFFKKKYVGLTTNYISFTSKQNPGKLPEEIMGRYEKKIIIFNSSTFEFDYIGSEYKYKFYDSQNDGISQIVKSLEGDTNIGVFLREHPNLANRDSVQRKEIRLIKAANFHLISAESDISSYKLLLSADIVVTFNSTMGIEATYWGIPSILCSNAIYENFNIAYKPSSHIEVIKLIKSKLKPICSDDVYKYGYYQSIFGVDYIFYKPADFFHGLFKGKDLRRRNMIYIIISKIYKKMKYALKCIVFIKLRMK